VFTSLFAFALQSQSRQTGAISHSSQLHAGPPAFAELFYRCSRCVQKPSKDMLQSCTSEYITANFVLLEFPAPKAKLPPAIDLALLSVQSLFHS
jgi:hypothetical protein